MLVSYSFHQMNSPLVVSGVPVLFSLEVLSPLSLCSVAKLAVSLLTLLLMVLLLFFLLLLLALCLTDPSASQTSSEEKLNQEAQQLEKRLSLLSHRCSTGRSQNNLTLTAFFLNFG